MYNTSASLLGALLARGGDLVSSRLVDQMLHDQLTVEQKSHGGLGPAFFDQLSWGFGIAIYADGSCGWDGGLGTSFRIYPAMDLTVITLTNKMFDSPGPPAIHEDVRSLAVSWIPT